MKFTKEMLEHLLKKNIKEIVKCNSGTPIKLTNKDEIVNEINKAFDENSKIDVYFKNGSEIGFNNTNETIRIYAKKKKIASIQNLDKFKEIVDKIYEHNNDNEKYREIFRNQEYKQYIIKFLRSLYGQEIRIEIKNDGTIILRNVIEDIPVEKKAYFNSLTNVIYYIKTGKIKKIFDF
jgi:antitoxin component of MazEF toxin-antitoxin module